MFTTQSTHKMTRKQNNLAIHQNEQSIFTIHQNEQHIFANHQNQQSMFTFHQSIFIICTWCNTYKIIEMSEKKQNASFIFHITLSHFIRNNILENKKMVDKKIDLKWYQCFISLLMLVSTWNLKRAYCHWKLPQFFII